MALDITGLGFGENNQHAGRPTKLYEFLQEVVHHGWYSGFATICEIEWCSVDSKVSAYRYWQYLAEIDEPMEDDGFRFVAGFDEHMRKCFLVYTCDHDFND